MFEALSLLTLCVSTYALAKGVRPAGKSEFALVFFCIATAQIIAFGYLLSAFDRLGDLRGWAAAGSLFLLAALFTALILRASFSDLLPKIGGKSLAHTFVTMKEWYFNETSGYERLLLIPMIAVTVFLGALNLAILISSAPHNFDSMAYHLARMAYYLQHGTLRYYPANYWAQVAHPKNSAVLLLYSYLMSARNENATQCLQFAAYWISVCAVYGIARKTGQSRTQGIFAALVSALLIEWIVEATTTQNDLIIAAYFGGATYFLFAFRETKRPIYLVLSASAIGLAAGTSAKSLLALPSVALVAAYCLAGREIIGRRLRSLVYFAGALILALCLFALPAGYAENYRQFGNALGPKELQEHSFAGKSAGYVAKNGTKNLLRFGFEFLALDGLPPVGFVREAESMLTALPRYLVDRLGIDLEASEAVLKPFRYQKPPIFFSHEDWCSWGVLGFGLIWIAAFLSLAGVIRSRDARILSCAALLVVLAVAYGGLYEPHRGRYLITSAVFAVPATGLVLRGRNRYVRSYLFLVILAGCISALSAVTLRPARPPVPMKALSRSCPEIRTFEFLPSSVFGMDRIAQLMTNNWAHYPAVRAFDLLVPEDATVAVFLHGDTYEYPLFGERLTRTIIPINAFAEGFQGIPRDADYLLYGPDFPRASSADLHLGADWYLRRLPGAKDEALQYYTKVVELYPGNARSRNFLGIEYAKKKLFHEAAEEFREAVRLAPVESSYRNNLDRAMRLETAAGEPRLR